MGIIYGAVISSGLLVFHISVSQTLPQVHNLHLFLDRNITWFNSVNIYDKNCHGGLCLFQD